MADELENIIISTEGTLGNGRLKLPARIVDYFNRNTSDNRIVYAYEPSKSMNYVAIVPENIVQKKILTSKNEKEKTILNAGIPITIDDKDRVTIPPSYLEKAKIERSGKCKITGGEGIKIHNSDMWEKFYEKNHSFVP